MKAAAQLYQTAQGLPRTYDVIERPSEDALLGKKPAPSLLKECAAGRKAINAAVGDRADRLLAPST